jgi:hypothetical protein
MKYLKLFENFSMSHIREICEYYDITDYSINPDGSIDVIGNVNFSNGRLTEIPIKFNKVDGNFNFSNNRLTTLEGCPKEVSGYFNVFKNSLTTLEGCPKYIGSHFSCNHNNLTSLENGPKFVGETFNCSNNNIKSLKGFETILNGSFVISNNNLESLVDCPNIRGSLHIQENKLTTLEGLPEVHKGILCFGNPIYEIFSLFYNDIKIYLDYQETYNFVRKDCRVVKYLLEEVIKDYNEYYNKSVELPKKIIGYTYI